MGINLVVARLSQAAASPKQAKLISITRRFVFISLGIITQRKLFPEKGISSRKFKQQSSALLYYAAAENTLRVL